MHGGELDREIEETAKPERRFALVKHYIEANVVAILAPAGSVAASVLATVSKVERWNTADVAVIPAAVFALSGK